MAFITVPNCAEVEIRQALDGQLIENTMYFQHPTPPTAAELKTLGDTMLNWFGSNILPNLSHHLTLREAYVTDLTEQDGPTATSTGFTPAAGGNAGESMPNAVALCVSFRTAARGRTGRGRNYISGLPDNLVLQNTIDTNFADTIVGHYNDLQDGLSAVGWTWVVVSRFFNGQPRAQGIARPVTAAIVTDLTVDSQRRRAPGRGT